MSERGFASIAGVVLPRMLAACTAAAAFWGCHQPAALKTAPYLGQKDIYIPGYGPVAVAQRSVQAPQIHVQEGFGVSFDSGPAFGEVGIPFIDDHAVSVDAEPARPEAAPSTAAFHAQLVNDIVAVRQAASAKKSSEPPRPREGGGKGSGPLEPMKDNPVPPLRAVSFEPLPKSAVGDAAGIAQVAPLAAGLPAPKASMSADYADPPSMDQFGGDLESIMYSEMLLAGSYQIQVGTSADFSAVVFEKSYFFTSDIDLHADFTRSGAENGFYWVRVAFIDLMNFESPFSKPRPYKFVRRR